MFSSRLSRIVIAAWVASFSLAATASQQRPWRDGFVSRLEILALLQTLNASLLSSRSATATLEKWCADHKMAAEAKVVARRVEGVSKPPSDETRRRLGVGEAEPVKYRRVQLVCGVHVLSEADNWYVPGRLSDDMNRVLDTTDTPFGKAVAPLQPFRQTIETRLRWAPLPEGWELSPGAPDAELPSKPLDVPHELIEHKAVLYGQDRKPFSEVHESYTSEILDFETHAPDVSLPR